MADKPNILVIWGDDVGMWNLSCFSHGVMGYTTPNIDRLATEGLLFTDACGEHSCTAGHASFATGQSVLRTGLATTGLPAAPVGIQRDDPTIAELLEPLGYATGFFGKSHFGDRNEYLPTVHGFEEFFGNFHHLNAEEDPAAPGYTQQSHERFGPRGVLRCWTSDADDSAEQPRWGRIGRQRIEDTGPLTRARACEDEFVAAAKEFITRQHDVMRPFFCWVNTTCMHGGPPPRPESVGQPEGDHSWFHDTMVDHDRRVGQLLDLLDELGISERTCVMYSSASGPRQGRQPSGGMTPFRDEHATSLEGAFRVPLLLRWPAALPGSVVVNDLAHHHDWLPTFLAMAGMPDIKERLRGGHWAGGRKFTVHLDGYNLLPFLTMKGAPNPRRGFIYFSVGGDLVAVRFGNWKSVFMEQRSYGTSQAWYEPFTTLRMPKLYNIRTDPFEREDVTPSTQREWLLDSGSPLQPVHAIVSEFQRTCEQFPPRHKGARFTIDQALEKMQTALDANR